MSVVLVDSACLLSALQPNSSCTAYALPSDGPSPDPAARARRVQEQVRRRLQENKKSSSLTRLDEPLSGSTDFYFPETKNLVHHHGFSSRSMGYTPSRVMAVPTVPLLSSGFSSHSAVESSYNTNHKRSSAVQSSFQTSSRRSKSQCQAEHEWLPPEVSSVPLTAPPSGSLRRSLSGTLAQDRSFWQEEPVSQSTYKGPSHRTISRIANRQQQQQESWQGTSRAVPAGGNSWGTQWQQHVSRAGTYQIPLKRTPSVRSVRSVGKGVDVLDGASIHSNDALAEMQGLDMVTAVRYLSEPDVALHVLGAAFIQHQCYHSNEAKNQVRVLHGIPALVQLFTSDNQEVQRYATGATRNLIYENADNKMALIDAGGLTCLIGVLSEPDEELRKIITGVLWNLSSRDNLKEKLCRDALAELTDNVLIPLSNSLPLSPSERDIFYNTTGCFRNLSSVNERTRQKMRDMRGLVDSLVSYIQHEDAAEDKGLENCLCVMRNLSYQLYTELPPSVRLRLEGPTRASASRNMDAISCFPLYSKKHTQCKQNLSVLSEVSRQPKGSEWLWHPRIVTLYKKVLLDSDSSATCREAAVGALQNITTGDTWWSSVLTAVVTEQEKMLSVLLDLLDSSSDTELRPLTGLLRNLSRHSSNKDHMAKTMVNIIVSKLPCDGLQKTPSSEVVSNLCGVLNHLVTCSSLAARDITYFNGLSKLVGIKTFHDHSPGRVKAARAASTVLYNMFQYNKLHKHYKLKGFSRKDFTDASM
ncbi:plakophilin-3-like isoform X2 [Solea solea]|uniref:plakophilin-3-like isoform X2 n=1 Tax=Solea solea TaxID=90069 RepID=UPI0027296A26|nr:plakophilin-3-like isoform X2 [Solea solea]